MRDFSEPTLMSEANPALIASLAGILAADFSASSSRDELEQRLSAKGYTLKAGYLATLPHGKLVCPIALVGG